MLFCQLDAWGLLGEKRLRGDWVLKLKGEVIVRGRRVGEMHAVIPTTNGGMNVVG